eukprot:gene14037-5015_t
MAAAFHTTKSKEDTWKESELLDAIQGQEKKKKSSSKSSKSGESSRHGTRDDKEKHRRSEASGSHRKDSDRKEKDRDREREKERVREREPVDGHEGSRQKPKEDGKRSHKEEKEKSSRRKDEKLRTESEDGRSRTKERERSDGKDKERRRDKEDAREKEKRDADKKGRREKDRDGSERKERKDREKDGDDGKERRREKDGEGSRSRHKEDGESKRKHHKSKREDKEREDSRESSKHRSSSSSKDGKSSKDRKDRHKEKKEKRKDESEVRYHENEPREDMGRTERSKERKSRDLPSVDENEPQESRQNDRKTEKDNPTAGHGPKFRKASIDKQNSYEEEIEDQSRRKASIARRKSSILNSDEPSTRDGVQGRLGTSSSTSVAKTQPRGKINFIAAKQKQISDKVASKTRRRGKELSKLIELDVVAMDLFELQPLNIYEVYMKSFGRTNTEQVAVQTNEDCLEQETQTEEIEAEAKWCQFSNEVQSFGGENENSSKANTTQSSTMSHDTKRLNKFLSKATQLCMTLLNEMADNEDKISDRYEQSEMKFSERFLKLDLKSQLTNGRQFVNTHTSNANLFLTAHGKSSLENSTISPDGVICVWKLNNSTEPQMYLSCGSTPKCCCFSPRKPSFAFAGMEDGSVSVWDLREPSSLHNRKKLGEKEIVLRSETFSTASVYGDDSHSSSVVSIEAIAPPEESSSASDGNSSDSIAAETGGTLQLASLEENGTINIWVVIEMFSPDPGGSQQDLGLLPGGKVKLVKSGSITLQLPRRLIDPSQKIAFIGTVLHVEPNHGKSLYIGTEQGVVLHSSRFGDKVTPKAFYISDKEYPITTWETFGQGAGILRVKWLHNKPSVFCTLDKNSVFCVWDLLKSDASPIFKETLRKSSKAKSLDFSLLGDSSDKKQQVVVFFDDNTAEIHKLAKSLCGNSNSDTNEILSRFEDIS